MSGNYTGRRFEEILGSASTRYFGHGYRRVAHAAHPARTRESPEGTEIHGTGSAMYPEDWSLDASSRARVVHLSSFDAIALTAAIMRQAAPLSARVRALLTGRVMRVRVKAPSRATTATESVDIVALCTSAADPRRGAVTARVDRFAVAIEVEPTDAESVPVDLQLYDSDAEAALSSGRIVQAAANVLKSIQELAEPASYLTCVEELAMFGQLSQIAVYAAKGLNRGSVPNLWLRQLTLERTATPPAAAIKVSTIIARDRLHCLGGDRVADLQLLAETNYGARAEASFGFRMPSQLDTADHGTMDDTEKHSVRRLSAEAGTSNRDT